MARYVSSVVLRACNEFEAALVVDAVLVEVAAVTVVEVTLVTAVVMIEVVEV